MDLLATQGPADCCGTAPRRALRGAEAARLAQRFKALGDPTRVRLLSLIASAPGGEACIGDLTEPVGLSQPTVSHHMKLLVDAGLATRDQRGRRAFSSVVDDTLADLAAALRTDALRV